MTPGGHFGANVILVISFNAIYVSLLAGNQTPTVLFVIWIYYLVRGGQNASVTLWWPSANTE